ncbi:hypothetical protein ACOSP7_002514 [Xanthoceras sorbifolium]|uniref:Uncharacterized protein n=1 Tax=Xanthoceras sorbifolium TaxID=99658 RepID=A0ABQ8IK13_9ROSI|nr:hypothetical protein JRO89_XS01G0159100 [Xanthoceras sorbifolium]
MKNVSRNNKFLLCFRPVVEMDQLVLESESAAVIDHGSRHSRAFKYINPDQNKSSLVSEKSKNSENSMMVRRRRPSNRTLSKVIKAVLFETILAKRVRDRKSLIHDSSYKSSKRSFSGHTHKSLDSSDGYIQEIKSNPVLSSQSSFGSSSSSSSSSSSTSCSTSSISESKRQNQNFKNQQESVVSTKPSKKDNNNMGFDTGTASRSFSCVITLLLIILTVTCLWGRLHAIFCTTTCLFYLPRRSKCRRRAPENEVKRLRKSETGDYQKKRIIMEGLLKRNHRRDSALNT